MYFGGLEYLILETLLQSQLLAHVFFCQLSKYERIQRRVKGLQHIPLCLETTNPKLNASQLI